MNRADLLATIQKAALGNFREIGRALQSMFDGDLLDQNQLLTASGAVNPYTTSLNVAHASVAIAATVADAKKHRGIFAITNTSASGTAAHTVTLTGGNFNGTNNRATLDAPGEALIVNIDENGNGQIIANIGGVALSTV
jgi:hypothetical protein